jgi:uncharacterized protein YjbI with pentapeptide repeats
LREANLRGAVLNEADLCGTQCSGAVLSEADLSEADLSEADLSGAILSRTNFSRSNLYKASVISADLSEADLTRANFEQADLRRAQLNGVDLSEATLQGAILQGATLRGAQLSGVDLRKTDLSGADLTRANFELVDLSQASLLGTNLSEVVLRGAVLKGIDLSGADLHGADLSGADLREANLKDVSFHMASLIEANLDSATLTDACLWETQHTGWSIRGIICEAIYLDRSRRERITYTPGEFERLYADKTKIVLHYEGGISPIEIATLPALIQRIEATHPGCILRLQSVQEAPGGATVTLVVDEGGGRAPNELQTLKADIEIVSQRAIRAQRALLEERGIREQAELKLQLLYDEIFPRIVRLITEKAQGIQISISGGTQYGNIVGEVSGAHAQIHYTHNDLVTIEALVREMSAHRAEVPLTSAERTQFEETLNAIQEQLASQAPNHSLLREALHSVRHILEAGVAHVLVGQWLPLLHKLG